MASRYPTRSLATTAQSAAAAAYDIFSTLTCRHHRLPTIEHGLRVKSNIVRRREQASMSRDPTHATRRRIMHHALQHHVVLVVFRGCDLLIPCRRRIKRRMRHLERLVDVHSRVLVQAASR